MTFTPWGAIWAAISCASASAGGPAAIGSARKSCAPTAPAKIRINPQAFHSRGFMFEVSFGNGAKMNGR
jgi:hypothetical protein